MTKSTGLDAALLHGEMYLWENVPAFIQQRYHTASQIKEALANTDCSVVWIPEIFTIFTDRETPLTKIAGNQLRVCKDVQPGNDVIWIKQATESAWPNAFSVMNKPYQWAGALTGGPTPLSNALVSGALGAGLGYAGGKLRDWWHGEEEDSGAASSLALAGGLAGAGMGLAPSLINARLNARHTGKSHWWDSVTKPVEQQPSAPHIRADGLDQRYLDRGKLPAGTQYDNLSKLAQMSATGFDTAMEPISVDAFNKVIWNDVHNYQRSTMQNPYGTRYMGQPNNTPTHTPPSVAAATAGLVTGVQQMYGNKPYLTPNNLVVGLASMGLPTGSAQLAGGVLGAMGVLSPQTAYTLQQSGAWGDMAKGVTQLVFGSRK